MEAARGFSGVTGRECWWYQAKTKRSDGELCTLECLGLSLRPTLVAKLVGVIAGSGDRKARGREEALDGVHGGDK